MAAKLTQLIPAQNFESVRDRIGLILAEELAAQDVLLDTDALGITVWVERFVAFDKTELPAINVSLAKGDYDNKDARQADGTYLYSVDCYASSPSTEDGAGDSLAAFALHKMLGMVRAILENPVYRTLDYTPPSISRVAVSGFQIAEPRENDAISVAQARIDFLVRVPETVELITALPIAGNDTIVKLALTNKGYRYVFNS